MTHRNGAGNRDASQKPPIGLLAEAPIVASRTVCEPMRERDAQPRAGAGSATQHRLVPSSRRVEARTKAREPSSVAGVDSATQAMAFAAVAPVAPNSRVRCEATMAPAGRPMVGGDLVQLRAAVIKAVVIRIRLHRALSPAGRTIAGDDSAIRRASRAPDRRARAADSTAHAATATKDGPVAGSAAASP